MDTSQLSPYTGDEIFKIRRLRERIQLKRSLREEQSTDAYLVKWLRARQHNLDKAEAMLLDSLAWREKHEVDTILDTLILPDKYRKSLPIAKLGQDSATGYPVMLFLLGKYDLLSKLEEYGAENIYRYHIYILEYITKRMFKECSEKTGKNADHLIELVDFDDYSYKQIANSHCREQFIRTQKMLDLNYPEILYRVSIFNTPKMFSIFYRLVSPFVAKATMNKISVCSSRDLKSELASKFPMDLVPPHWGGSRPGRDQFCTGDPIWFLGYQPVPNDWEITEVKAGRKVHLPFEVTKRSSIVWKFKIDAQDIFFGIYHSDHTVLPSKRFAAGNGVQAGETLCESDGIFIVVFDNSYSYLRDKVVYYNIQIMNSDTTSLADKV